MHRNRMIKKLLLTTLLTGQMCISWAQRIPSDQIQRVISYLSSDALQGRGTSTPDEKKAALFIAEQFKSMQIAPKGTKWYYYDFTYKHDNNIHDTLKLNTPYQTARNVMAFIDNQAEKTIVIGAHYDHLGLGYQHNSLAEQPEGKIHNGADDNASGVAGVLALAHYLSTNGVKENHNFLFMTFSGEELGLIGSKKWCAQPNYPLSKISCMINLDMIGRLNDSTKKLLIYGTGTSDIFEPILNQTNTQFNLKLDSSGTGPSDQTSFYLQNIPVLHFFTGQHSDYHKPTDDADKININGEVAVLEYIIDVIHAIDNAPKIPFYKTKSKSTAGNTFKVTMGIMPDYAFEGNGLRLDGVSENKPAFKSGLMRGDIIQQIDHTSINNVDDYMKFLNSCTKGQRVQVIFERKNVRMETSVEF